MDEYVSLHICDSVLPKDIPLDTLQNKIVIVEEVEGQKTYTLIRDPDKINFNYDSDYISSTYKK